LREKILAIDDSPDLLRILQVCLEREKYRVFTAGNGREGLQRIYSSQPDLVILDVMMPGMDGWEVLSRLREMSDVPVIMLTAKGREVDIVRGLGSISRPPSFGYSLCWFRTLGRWCPTALS